MGEDETRDRRHEDTETLAPPRAGRLRDRRTTLPDPHRVFAANDSITALRAHGIEVEYRLPFGKLTYSLGSDPACDVAIESSFLSRLHCVLERRGGGLRVHDQSSRNGTSSSARRPGPFEIAPGDSFVAASTRSTR